MNARLEPQHAVDLLAAEGNELVTLILCHLQIHSSCFRAEYLLRRTKMR